MSAHGDEVQGGMALQPHLLAAVGQEGVAVHDRQHDVLPLHARLARAGLHDANQGMMCLALQQMSAGVCTIQYDDIQL